MAKQTDNRNQNSGELILGQLENRIDITTEGVELIFGADKEVVLGHEVGSNEGEDDGREESADEAFPCLTRRERDERGFSKVEAPDEGPDIVTDDEETGEEEPEETAQDVDDVEGSGEDHTDHGHDSPSELAELATILALLESENESDEADGIKGVRDERMVVHEELSNSISKEDLERSIKGLTVHGDQGSHEEPDIEKLVKGDNLGVIFCSFLFLVLEDSDAKDFIEAPALDNDDEGDQGHVAEPDQAREERDHDDSRPETSQPFLPPVISISQHDDSSSRRVRCVFDFLW